MRKRPGLLQCGVRSWSAYFWQSQPPIEAAAMFAMLTKIVCTLQNLLASPELLPCSTRRAPHSALLAAMATTMTKSATMICEGSVIVVSDKRAMVAAKLKRRDSSCGLSSKQGHTGKQQNMHRLVLSPRADRARRDRQSLVLCPSANHP